MDKSIPTAKKEKKLVFQNVMLVAGDEKYLISPATVYEPEFQKLLLEQLAKAKSTEISAFSPVLTWKPSARLAFFALIREASKLKVHARGHAYSCTLDAALVSPPKDSSTAALTAWYDVLCEIVAVFHTHEMDVPCSKIADAAKKYGLSGITVARTRKAVAEKERHIRRQAQRETLGTGMLVSEVFTGLPDDCPPDLILPPSWTYQRGLLIPDESLAAQCLPIEPYLITAASKDSAGRCHVSIAWLQGDKWSSLSVPREQIADARSITALAAYRAPVTSNDSRSIVRYLQEFERVNNGKIPQGQISSQLGWQGNEGCDGFLLGKTLLADTADTQWAVQFRGNDTGDDQLASGFQHAGSFKKWKKLASELSDYPVVMLCLFAGLSAPLLRLFGVSNFVVDISGETSTGKSTCARFALSAWGVNDESDNSLFRSFKATNAWRERAPTVFSDLPFCLDETKHAEHPDEVKQLVYMVNQGRSKGRASRQGTQESHAMRNVMILTGEQPATSFTNDGGTCVRTLTLRRPAFGGRSKATGKLVDRVQPVTRANYGHAGEKLVKHIVAERGRWDEWRVDYQSRVEVFRERAGDSAYARRLSPYLALIQFTAALAHDVLQLPWKHQDPVEPLYEDLCREAQKADRAADALRAVVEYAVRHPQEFDSGNDKHQGQTPFSGWAGIWKRNSGVGVPTAGGSVTTPREWDYIGFFESKLDEILRKLGYTPAEVKGSWHQRDWLKVSNEKDAKRRQYKVRIGGNTIWTIAITYEAYQQVTNRAT